MINTYGFLLFKKKKSLHNFWYTFCHFPGTVVSERDMFTSCSEEMAWCVGRCEVFHPYVPKNSSTENLYYCCCFFHLTHSTDNLENAIISNDFKIHAFNQ